ncbi:inverse autotransporter beta domain-containing protein, partial [Salmonella enterica]|nr:inverse autotransporter beta domain-containing protein [Salmonella enterica]
SYRFGVPWSEQINPQRVGAIRTMAGTRYDLADRNYDIVLQYRKQELISLSIGADKNPGYTGESVTLTATARSKYGLARVDWSAPELLAAGGALTPVAKDGSVVRVDLPSVVSPKAPLRARKVTAGDPFIIEGVAYDREGNEARATLELNVVRST